jgi:hypothetical protein
MCFWTNVRKLSLLPVLFMMTGSSFSDAAVIDRAGFHVTVEPIIGYEWTQVVTPSVRTRGMLVYGGRFTVGHKLLSGEGEYTQGTTNETFPTIDQNLKTDKQNARLGLRTSKTVGPFLDFLFRAGGQASKTQTTTTTISSATSLTDSPDWEIHPYAGVGVQGNLAGFFSIALEATYLFRNLKDWSGNDVQTSASVKIQLPR